MYCKRYIHLIARKFSFKTRLISHYTSTTPVKKNRSSNRQGPPPPPPPLSRGFEKPEGPSALQPTTEIYSLSPTNRNYDVFVACRDFIIAISKVLHKLGRRALITSFTNSFIIYLRGCSKMTSGKI